MRILIEWVEWVAPCCRQSHRSRRRGHRSRHRRPLPPHSGHL